MSITIGKLNKQVQELMTLVRQLEQEELVTRVRQLEQEVASLKSERAAASGSRGGGSSGSSSGSSGSSSGSGSIGPLYVVPSSLLNGVGNNLMSELRGLFPHRQLIATEIDNLPPNAEDVFLNIRPVGKRMPMEPSVTSDLERIFAATGVRAFLLIGEIEDQFQPGKMMEKWLAIDLINPGLYKGKAVYFRTLRQDDFLSWASGAKDLVKLTMGAGAPPSAGGSSRMQMRSALSFDPTPADFKLGKKF